MAVLTLRRQKTTSLMLSLSITSHQVPHQSTSEVFDPLPSLRGDEIHVVYNTVQNRGTIRKIFCKLLL